MAKIIINVYTNMDNHEENVIYNAITDNNVIKYIDSDNNKFVVDCNKNILIKENNEFNISIDFGNNLITIFMKEFQKSFEKEIQTLAINYDKNIRWNFYKNIDFAYKKWYKFYDTLWRLYERVKKGKFRKYVL